MASLKVLGVTKPLFFLIICTGVIYNLNLLSDLDTTFETWFGADSTTSSRVADGHHYGSHQVAEQASNNTSHYMGDGLVNIDNEDGKHESRSPSSSPSKSPSAEPSNNPSRFPSSRPSASYTNETIRGSDEYDTPHNTENLLLLTSTSSSSSSSEHNVVGQELHLDLLVYLRGEMANELLKMAQGHVIQSIASNLDPPIHLTLRYKVHSRHKSKYARDTIQDCFYNFEKDNVNMSEFGDDEDEEFWNNQTSIIQDLLQNKGSEVLLTDTEGYDETTIFFIRNGEDGRFNETSIVLKLQQIRTIANQMASANKLIQTNDDSKPILSTPYLRTDDFFEIQSPQVLDKYYEELRELFSFNEERCCEETPEPDDTVFHVRGFKEELPSHREWWDAWPEITLEKLIPELEEGDKVLVLPGKNNVVNVTEYKEFFGKRGIQTRGSKNKAGTQDFCQLLKAKKGVVGNFYSTFYLWGALFGSAEKVVIYSQFPRKEHPFLPDYSSYNFTHPFLKSRNITAFPLILA